MRYRTLFTAVMIAALAATSCSKDDIVAKAAGDPIPAGMATVAVVGVAGAVSGIGNMISQGIVDTPPAAQAAQQRIAIGAFPEPASVNCADGGTMTFSNKSSTGFTATFAGCKDGPYTADATAVVTNMNTKNCLEDGANHDVPTTFTALINGSVAVGSATVNLTNVGILLKSSPPPTYNGATDAPEIGGTCSILTASLHATGTLSETIGGETTTIDLGSNSLDVDAEDLGGATGLTINGDLTFATLCSDGTALTLVTQAELVVPDGQTKPTSGVLEVNGVPVDYATNPSAVPCTGLL